MQILFTVTKQSQCYVVPVDHMNLSASLAAASVLCGAVCSHEPVSAAGSCISVMWCCLLTWTCQRRWQLHQCYVVLFAHMNLSAPLAAASVLCCAVCSHEPVSAAGSCIGVMWCCLLLTAGNCVAQHSGGTRARSSNSVMLAVPGMHHRINTLRTLIDDVRDAQWQQYILCHPLSTIFLKLQENSTRF